MANRVTDDGTEEILDYHHSSDAKLKFRHPLTWRAGKPIPVGDLLKRLKALAQELQGFEQEAVDRDSVAGPAKELASHNLLNHKDKGVKAWTARCLVEVLRLCAPDAPYSGPQLKDVYSLFVTTIIPSLGDPQNPYNNLHIDVLESLATVKSIILLVDIPSSGSLILRLFESCFDILSSPENNVAKGVEFHMSGVLQCMIEEADALPNQVVDIILAQFLRADPRASAPLSKNKKNGQTTRASDAESILQFHRLPSSYVLAKNLCNTCVQRMARYISQYFSNVIMDTSTFSSGTYSKPGKGVVARSEEVASDEDMPDGPSEEDIINLERAHQLLRELWRSCPGTLQNVVPQIEAELSADNIDLRRMATEAVGDLIAGIGAAGPPSAPQINPAAYPPMTLSSEDLDSQQPKGPFAPSSPQWFGQVHVSVYQNFLSRRNDKSPLIRASWTTCIGRILTTSAGGAGLGHQTQQALLEHLSEMLVDSDPKVRVAATEVIGLFRLRDLVDKVGPYEEVAGDKSILRNLAQRAKDQKSPVRNEAIAMLAKLWASGFGEITAGNTATKELLAPVLPSVFNAPFINDKELMARVDMALFDYLAPVNYPTIKKPRKSQSNGANAQIHVGIRENDLDPSSLDSDKLRAERLLLLGENLESRAKDYFYHVIARPVAFIPYMDAFLTRCEELNGGVSDRTEKEIRAIKANMGKLIEFFSSGLLEPARAADDLWKFVKIHDRRCYALIRFCMASDSDYRKVQKSLKELEKRIDGFPSSSTTIKGTIMLLVKKASNLFFNKSHIRPIIEFSQTNEKGLGSIAHDLLKLIADKNPSIFSAHAEELCHSIEAQAPSKSKANEANALDSLKTCSTFSKRFPDRIIKDRKFFQALLQYAVHGTPAKTAKHAVSIIMAAAGSKKQMYAKDLLKQCVDGFKYGQAEFMTKLACLSQLMLLSAKDLEGDVDPVLDIAIGQVLHQNRTAAESSDSKGWQEEPDTECEAKLWALKILVNRLRNYDDVHAVSEIAVQVYRLLNSLLQRNGEIPSKSSNPTPEHHKARLRLQAALLYVKLCTKRGFDQLLRPKDFNQLALVTFDKLQQVRSAFARSIMKHLGRDRLPSRFHAVLFLLAYEPSKTLKDEVTTWLRARSRMLARREGNPGRTTQTHVMEAVFARLLSLLAHHPDYSPHPEDLTDSLHYILFYLTTVATPDNISLIYHVAQRVKSIRDAIVPTEIQDYSVNLYTLSDLAQSTIRHLADTQNWTLEAHSGGKSHMPTGIFASLPSHDAAQQIADTTYLPDGMEDQIESLVRAALKTKSRPRNAHHSTVATASKKRKTSDADAHAPSKRRVTSSGTPRRAKSARQPPRRGSESPPASADRSSNVPESERRRSGRGSRKSYAERGESEDEEMLEVAEWEYDDGRRVREGGAGRHRTAADSHGSDVGDDGIEDKADELADENERRSKPDGEGEGHDEGDPAQIDGSADATEKERAKAKGKENTTPPSASRRRNRRGGSATAEVSGGGATPTRKSAPSKGDDKGKGREKVAAAAAPARKAGGRTTRATRAR